MIDYMLVKDIRIAVFNVGLSVKSYFYEVIGTDSFRNQVILE